MSKSELRQRTQLVGIRLTVEEHDALVQEASGAGCTVQQLMVHRTLRHSFTLSDRELCWDTTCCADPPCCCGEA